MCLEFFSAPERVAAGVLQERRVDAAAARHGLILRVIGDRIVFAPPLVMEEEEIGEVGARLGRALDEVAGELKAGAAA